MTLENEYKKSSNWNKDKIKQLSQLLRLKESQVYKWNWDRKQIEEKKIMKTWQNIDKIPMGSKLFKVSKICKNAQNEDIEVEIINKSYFKVLKSSNFKKI